MESETDSNSMLPGHGGGNLSLDACQEAIFPMLSISQLDGY